MRDRVQRIMALVQQYGLHFAEATLHQSASRADISATAAAKALASIRMQVESLDELARADGQCTRVLNDGRPCGLTPPCPDCGPAVHDVPEGS